MRIPVVRAGDFTTTGGTVLVVKAHISDKGKKIALHGEHATCGNCEGSWPIDGTGEEMNDHGIPVACEGDRVLCPCGNNRVVAGADAGCFIHKQRDGASVGKTNSLLRQPVDGRRFDEQFALLDTSGRPLPGVRYRIVTGDGREVAGITDSDGKTQRVSTQTASPLTLQLEK